MPVRKRILVVDDDRHVQSVVAAALRGYVVEAAYSGDEALARVGADVAYDLVITDYLMPDMLGDEVVGRLRERRPDVRVLVLTGHHDSFEAERPEWWVGVPHLAKPFTVGAIRAAVAALIGEP